MGINSKLASAVSIAVAATLLGLVPASADPRLCSIDVVDGTDISGQLETEFRTNCDVIELLGSGTLFLDNSVSISSPAWGQAARDVTLRAAADSVVTLDVNRGSGTTGMVTNEADTVRIENLIFTGASNRAIFASGELHLKDTTFTENSSSGAGGAVYAANSVYLTGDNVFTRNVSSGGNAGALFVNGATLSSTGTATFSENSANFQGGSIYSGATTTTFENLNISSSYAGTNGGGIYGRDITITGDFQALNVSSGAGGGLVFASENFRMNTGTFASLSADGGAGAVYSNGEFTASGALSISQTSANSNASGGAIRSYGDMSFADLTLYQVSGPGLGGALYSATGDLTISGDLNATSVSSVLSGGVAVALGDISIGGDAVLSQISAGGSGALYSVTKDVIVNGDFTISQAGVTGTGAGITAKNSVTIGGDLVASQVSAQLSGGVIYAESGAVTVVGNTNISEAGSQSYGGAIRANGAVSLSTATFDLVSAVGDGGCIYSATSSVTITGAVSASRCISSGSGGAIAAFGDINLAGGTFSLNTATYSGGAIYSAQGAVTFTEHAGFTRNSASLGGAIVAQTGVAMTSADFTENSALADGGAIAGLAGPVVFTGDVQATNNYAETNGGAIAAFSGLQLTTGTFTGNSAFINGGALWVPDGNLSITGETTFENNSASVGDAGAIGATNNVTMAAATFKGNSAAWDGGAIKVIFGDLTFNGDGNFEGNTATSGFGGAMSVGGSLSAGNLSLTDSSAGIAGGAFVNGDADISGKLLLDGNAATSSGGGVLGFGDVAIATLEAIDNQADGYGGAIAAVTGDITISGTSLVERNVALFDGGALFALDINLSNGSFSENHSDGAGGAIYAMNSANIGAGSLFEANTAVMSAGAVFGAQVDVRGVLFENNQSGGSGGAVFGTTLAKIHSSSFYRNSTDLYGGAVHSPFNLIATNNTFVENSTFGEASGGGALSSDGLIEAGFNTFLDNSADFGTQIYTADLGIIGNVFASDGNGEIYVTGDLTDVGGNMISGELFYDFSQDSKLKLGSSIGLSEVIVDEVSGFHLVELLSSSPARGAVSSSMLSAVSGSADLTDEFKALFAGDSPEYASDLIGNERSGSFDAGALQHQATGPVFASPYEGPIVMVPADLGALLPGAVVQFEGSNLEKVTEITIGGKDAKVNVISDSLLEVTVPEIEAGDYNLMVTSSFGQLSVFPEVSVGEVAVTSTELVIIVKRISDTEAKIWAKNVIGAGKVQFMVNGKEIAWIRAVDETSPRLRFANNSYYFVRTVKLEPGKNALEIYVDGQRVRRVAYTG